MNISKDTLFCQGHYNLPNGITIKADNIKLDCKGAVLDGSLGINNGIDIQGTGNVIKNCIIVNYSVYGIRDYNRGNNIIENNIVLGPFKFTNEGEVGIYLYSPAPDIIRNNIIRGLYTGMVMNEASDIIYNNNFTENERGVVFGCGSGGCGNLAAQTQQHR